MEQIFTAKHTTDIKKDTLENNKKKAIITSLGNNAYEYLR